MIGTLQLLLVDSVNMKAVLAPLITLGNFKGSVYLATLHCHTMMKKKKKEAKFKETTFVVNDGWAMYLLQTTERVSMRQSNKTFKEDSNRSDTLLMTFYWGKGGASQQGIPNCPSKAKGAHKTTWVDTLASMIWICIFECMHAVYLVHTVHCYVTSASKVMRLARHFWWPWMFKVVLSWEQRRAWTICVLFRCLVFNKTFLLSFLSIPVHWMSHSLLVFKTTGPLFWN